MNTDFLVQVRDSSFAKMNDIRVPVVERRRARNAYTQAVLSISKAMPTDTPMSEIDPDSIRFAKESK